jgi:hypothetical protein
MSWIRTTVPCLLILSSVALLVSPGPAQAVPRAAGADLAGSRFAAVGPSASLPSGAVADGAVDATQRLTVDIVLRPRDSSHLGRLAQSVSTPGSPSFGRYLGRNAFARKFGGNPTAAASLRSLASAVGVSTGPATDGLFLPVSGTAGQLERLFHTRLVRVRLADGTTGRLATAPAELPQSVTDAVEGVVGLDDLVHIRPASLVSRSVSERELSQAVGQTRGTGTEPLGPHACAAAQAEQKSTSGVFTDDTIASIYGADGLYGAGADGTGQTIAVYELEPFAASDVAAFDTCYFGTTAAAAMADRLRVIPVDGGQPPGVGVGEAALDIENVSALAPGARIDVYEAPNTTAGSLDEFSRIIGDDTASVVTTSAGLCEAAMQSGEPGVQEIENLLFEQAAAQGQTVIAAAGDSGSSDCGTDGEHAVKPSLSVDDPASQPYVLGIGGTSVPTGISPTESAWNDGPAGGAGGGGLSQSWTAPSWQVDSAVPRFANPTVISSAEEHSGARFCAPDASICREVPDVSAAADPEAGAITVFYNGSWTAEGGTSSSAPLWAAMLGDTASSAACQADDSSGHGLGFATPLLYAVASDPATYAASFHDVTAGTNAIVPGSDGLYPATAGYDMATGLGSPQLTGPGDTPGLAEALCAAATPSEPTIERLSPTTVPVTVASGQGAPLVTVQGTGFEDSDGRVLVASVSIGGVRIPVTTRGRFNVTVVSATTLVVRIPPGAKLAPHGSLGDGAGSYQVVVTLLGGASSQPGPQSLLNYVATADAGPVPTVTAVGPTGGPRSGGGTVTIYGSDFDSATGIDFGSVPASAFHVVSDDQLTATVPAASSATSCATATDPTTDVCQVEVVVTSPGGSSAASPILPPYQGAYSPDPYGAFPAPVGCNCETTPAATEYDYLASPEITSVSADTGADGRQYISAYGHSSVVVHGSGFDILGYLWTDLGPWADAASVDNSLVSISPTELTLSTPAAPSGAALPLALPLTVQTLASPNIGDLASATAPSNAAQVVYAPVPTVSGLRGGTQRSAGPTSGGTVLTVTGTGFEAAISVLIVDQVPGAPSEATTSSFTVHGSNLRFATPPAAVGVDNVLVCTTTTCSSANPQVDTFTYFAPGDPALTSTNPDRGPSDGGTAVVLHGTNLGFVMGVRFGSGAATTFSNPKGVDDGGDPTAVDVVAPPGRAGTTVFIRVETLASLVDGTGYSPATDLAVFTYPRQS